MTDIGQPGAKKPPTATEQPQADRPATERAATDRADARKPGSAPGEVPPPAAPGPVRAQEGRSHGIALLPQDERDKLTLRLQHAVTEFVDGPRDSVEEADRVLEEISARFTEALAGSRRTLRSSWQTSGERDTGDTEQFRLALRDYRELAERLLRL